MSNTSHIPEIVQTVNRAMRSQFVRYRLLQHQADMVTTDNFPVGHADKRYQIRTLCKMDIVVPVHRMSPVPEFKQPQCKLCRMQNASNCAHQDHPLFPRRYMPRPFKLLTFRVRTDDYRKTKHTLLIQKSPLFGWSVLEHFENPIRPREPILHFLEAFDTFCDACVYAWATVKFEPPPEWYNLEPFRVLSSPSDPERVANYVEQTTHYD